MSDAFTRRDGHLWAEKLPLDAVAERYGTPCYVYSKAALSEHFRAWRDAPTRQDKLICYAVKANSNLAVLNLLARLDAGFDIVSGGELQRVLRAGGDPARVVFSGVGKQAGEMRLALEAGIRCFNLESEAELETLARVAADLGQVAPVSVRVNPDVDARTHPYISTGLRDNKFGVAIEDAPRVYRRAAQLEHIRVVGVDCHIGSQLTELSPFLDALDRVLVLADQLAGEGIELEHLDLGGGLGVCYGDEIPPHPAEYLARVSERLGECPLSLIFEPGRSIAANAGVFLTRVEYLKHAEHRNFAVVDGAMNDMLRPALYDAWMNLEAARKGDGEARRYDVVGPVCETGDFLARDRELALAPGDLLCLFSAGAYGFTMSSNYNSRGRPPEVVVDGEDSYLVRRRETFEDLVRGESVLPE